MKSPINSFVFILVLVLISGGCTGCPSSQLSLDSPESESTEEPALDSLERFVESRARSLEDVEDLGPLVADAAERRLILMGESSHGTREFYEWRARLSLAIAEEVGLDFVAVEGDWHALRAADRYVMGQTDDEEELEKLLVDTFDRWPEWMWANEEFAAFLREIRQFNAANPDRPIRIYGIDVHAFFESMERLSRRVADDFPDKAQDFDESLRCLRQFFPEGRAYLQALQTGRTESCEPDIADAAEMIAELYPGESTDDLSAREHMRTIVSGEAQFRGPAQGNPDQHWNARVRHFYEVSAALLDHHGPQSRGAVWAHNTHIGDARGTTMAARNRLNIGQLSRQDMGEEQVLSVGFSTSRGAVIAGRQWGAPLEVMDIPDAPEATLDGQLRQAGPSSYFVRFRPEDRDLAYWAEMPGQLGIGVVYDPSQYRARNFAPTNPAQRFDALIFIAETTPLTPLGQ